MTTPEGKLKEKVDKFFKHLNHCYSFSPVQMGMGRRTVDRLVCIDGKFVGIELKAPGEKPTKLQEHCLRDIEHAGGIAFWTDSYEGFLATLVLKGLIDPPYQPETDEAPPRRDVQQGADQTWATSNNPAPDAAVPCVTTPMRTFTVGVIRGYKPKP